MTDRLFRGAFAIAIVAISMVMANPLVAQDPAPPDTLPRPDTAVFVVPPDQLPVDTLPSELLEVEQDTVVPDSLIPAPNFPAFPDPAREGWAETQWIWDRVELQRFHGLSVLDLLRRIPSLTVTRGGVYGRPTGVAAFGLGGGRVRVFLDGYELDPLSTATLDLQQLALVDLDELRVERGLTGTRIEITSLRLDDVRPFTYVEAAAGNDETRLLRGYFSRTVGGPGVLSLGFDLVDTEGLPRREPFTVTTGIARYSYAFRPDAGIQIEYRQANVGRADSVFPVDASYRSWILRGRARALPGLWVDGIVGRSSRAPEEGDSLGVDLASNQVALRATYEGGAGWAAGAARFRFGGRTGYPAPDLDLSVRTGFQPLPGLALSGEARYSGTDGIGGTEISGGVRVGSWLGLSLFGTAATGTRGLGIRRDSIFDVVVTREEENEDGDTVMVTDTVPERTFLFSARQSPVDGVRVGAEWSGLGATIGAAWVSLDSELAAPFGFAFDAGVEPVNAEGFRGLEAYLSTPVIFPPLRFDGSYTYSADLPSQPYLPDEQWRAAFTFHDLFYTGNLEPTFRVEAVRRGSALVPAADGPIFAARSDPYTLLNAYIQIRVIDVQAFLVWENLLNADEVADLPGRTFPGQRALYGIRWHFRN